MSVVRTVLLICGVVGVGTACGSVNKAAPDDASPPADAREVVDGGVDLIDAAPVSDAAPTIDASPTTPDAAQPTRSRAELTGAAGRVSGGDYTLDVQIGHTRSQKPATGGEHTITGDAVIKP